MIRYYQVVDSAAWPLIHAYAADAANHVTVITVTVAGTVTQTLAVGDRIAANTHYYLAFEQAFGSQVTQYLAAEPE